MMPVFAPARTLAAGGAKRHPNDSQHVPMYVHDVRIPGQQAFSIGARCQLDQLGSATHDMIMTCHRSNRPGDLLALLP